MVLTRDLPKRRETWSVQEGGKWSVEMYFLLNFLNFEQGAMADWKLMWRPWWWIVDVKLSRSCVCDIEHKLIATNLDSQVSYTLACNTHSTQKHMPRGAHAKGSVSWECRERKARTRNEKNRYLQKLGAVNRKRNRSRCFCGEKKTKNIRVGEGPVSSESARGASAHQGVSEQLEWFAFGAKDLFRVCVWCSILSRLVFVSCRPFCLSWEPVHSATRH
jgi:hypothetical protein